MLQTRTAQKLARFKAEAARRNAIGPYLTPLDWRWSANHAFKFGPGYMRFSFNQGETVRTVPQYNGGSRDFVEKFHDLQFHCDAQDLPGFRAFSKATDLLYRCKVTGYYGDDSQNEVLTGIVGVFRWGASVWVCPGVQYSDSDLDYFDLLEAEKLKPCEAFTESGYKTEELSDLMRDMAGRAMQMAETEAEESREADIEYQAEELKNALSKKITKTKVQARALIREIRDRGAKFSPEICEALRGTLSGMLADIRECRNAKLKIERSPWEYLDYFGLVN